MADKFPSAFVDKKTGQVKRLATLWDKFEGGVLPTAADYVMMGAKVALLAPLVGGALVAAPVAATFHAAVSRKYRRLSNLGHDQLLIAAEAGELAEFDLNTQSGKEAFEEIYGDCQPSLAEDCLKMAKMAGMKGAPRIIVKPFYGYNDSMEDYIAAAASRADGSEPIFLVGERMLTEFKPGAVRATLAHELTHMKLGHTKHMTDWISREKVNKFLNIALIAAAVFGPLHLLPVALFIGVSYFGEKCLKSIHSRHKEELCDRGAAILTGGTADLSSALKNLDDLQMDMAMARAAARSRWGSYGATVKKEGIIRHFLNSTHPTFTRRDKLLTAFENKYHSFCEQQRGVFAAIFNQKAKAKKPAEASSIFDLPKRQRRPEFGFGPAGMGF